LGRLIRSALPAQSENGGFLRFFAFGTAPAIFLAWLADGPAATSGRQKMTNTSLSQLATSIVAALVASTLFISAAVGPVTQFI
jgi:hypothetical protein